MKFRQLAWLFSSGSQHSTAHPCTFFFLSCMSHPWFILLCQVSAVKKFVSDSKTDSFFSKVSRLITFDPTVINYLKDFLRRRSVLSIRLISRGAVSEEQKSFEEFRSWRRSVANMLERSGRLAEIWQAFCLLLCCSYEYFTSDIFASIEQVWGMFKLWLQTATDLQDSDRL